MSLERIVAEIDAVEASVRLPSSAASLLAPERLSAACIGPSEERFVEALERVTPSLGRGGVRIVLLGGRSRQGRVGRSRRRSSDGGHRARRLGRRTRTAMVDFTRPDAALANVERGIDAGVAVRRRHDRVGHATSTARRAAVARLLRAELRDRRRADDALRRRGVALPRAGARSWSCTTRPSSTARPAPRRRRQRAHGDAMCRSTRCGCRASSRTRRCCFGGARRGC